MENSYYRYYLFLILEQYGKMVIVGDVIIPTLI